MRLRSFVLVFLCSVGWVACGEPRNAAGSTSNDSGIHSGGGDGEGSDTSGLTDTGGADTFGVEIAGHDAEVSPLDAKDEIDAAGPEVDAGPDVDAGGPDLPCSGTTPKPDGGCCPNGQGFDSASASCVAFGPPGCQGSAQDCVPVWCVDWQDASGKPCDAKQIGCLGKGRACTAEEVAAGKGCPAGLMPSTYGCAVSGSAVALPEGVTWSGDALVVAADASPVAAADLNPGAAPPALPALDPPHEVMADGALAACPVGTVAGVPGVCTPLTGVAWTCPPGFVVAGPGCAPDPLDCGTDAFGGVQDAVGTVFVDATATAKATGQRTAPFPTVDAAMVALPAGGTIVVAAGTYATAIDTAKPLTLRGRCAAKVTLQGKSGLSVVHGYGKAAFTVQGVTITGGREPVRFDGPAQATVKRTMITGGTRFGLFATGNTTVSANDLYVYDIQPSSTDKSVGQGLHADDGAHLIVQNVRLSANRDRGLYADGPDTQVTAQNLVIDGTLAEVKTGNYGDGISASTGAQVVVQGARLTANRTVGLLAIGLDSAVTATDLWIDGTLPQNSDGKGGRGVTVLSGGKVDLHRALLTNNRSTGVLADGNGTRLHARALRIQGTLADAGGGAGQGLDCEGGAHVTLEFAHLEANRSEAVIVIGPETKLTATALLVESTLARPKDKKSGVGVAVYGGAQVQLVQSRLSSNRFAGLYVDGADSEVEFTGVIDATLGTELDGKGGYGVLAVNQGEVHLGATTRLSANHAIGCLVAGVGSAVQGDAITIDGTLPQTLDDWGGRGAGVEEGASLALESSNIWKNRDVGLYAAGSGSTLALDQVRVIGTLPRADGHGGRGVAVKSGAVAMLKSLRIIGNREVGLVVDGTGTLVEEVDSLVAGTLPREDGKYGFGLQVTGGAKLWVGAIVKVVGNASAGLVVDGAGTTVAPGAKSQGDTYLYSHGNGGRGVVVQAGAHLDLTGLQIWRNQQVGLSLDGVGSQVHVMQLIVLETEGRGAEVSRGASLTVQSAAVLALNRSIALMVAGKPSEARLSGARIVQTLAALDKSLGHGVQVQDGALATLLGPRLSGQRETALYVRAATLDLTGGWLAATLPSEGKIAGLAAALVGASAAQVTLRACRMENLMGAGVLLDSATAVLEASVLRAVTGLPQALVANAADGVSGHLSTISLERSWIAGANRVGLLVDGKGATVHASRIDGCGVGLALQHNGLATESASWVAGNGKDHATGGNLALFAPPPPAPMSDASPLSAP